MLKMLILLLISILWNRGGMCHRSHHHHIKGADGKIINGTLVLMEEHPYQVAIWNGDHKGDFIFLGGGSIITYTVVLTSASMSLNYRPTDVTADCRLLYRPHQNVPIKKFIRHPKYTNKRKAFRHNYDIAVIILKKSLRFNSRVQPARLARNSQHEITVGMKMNVTGWGQTQTETEDRNYALHRVEVPVLDQMCCELLFNNKLVTEHHFCTGLTMLGIQESWYGDGGGPVVHNGVQYGIILIDHDAIESTPALKLSVAPFISWIKEAANLTEHAIKGHRTNG